MDAETRSIRTAQGIRATSLQFTALNRRTQAHLEITYLTRLQAVSSAARGL